MPSASLLHADSSRRLLLLQRNVFAARSLARHLQAHFDHIELATDVETAELILRDPSRSPTHLVCGQNFGPGIPLGSQLIPAWRLAYPSLRCVVLATGEPNVPSAIDGVDAVFLKPASPAPLVDLLCRV